jgi:uncharacterized protein
VDHDDEALGPLDEAACRAFLEAATLGRLALSVRALPVVLPVDFVVRGNDLILRIGAAEGFGAACDGTVVALQVDGADVGRETGWSVLVQGRARVLRPGDELLRAEGALSAVWAGPGTHLYVSLGMELVTGHRLGRKPFGSGLAATGSCGPG